jgi:hypothetical protein
MQTKILTVAALALTLSSCHALFGADDPNDECDCSQVDKCIPCTTTDSTSPCFDKCQWCIPKLSCQKVAGGLESCPASKIAPSVAVVIGAHHEFSCQDETGNGPVLNQVLFTTKGSDVPLALWNGSDSTMADLSTFDGVPTNPVKGEHTIEIRGLNFGEQNVTQNSTTTLLSNQAIRICPFVNMDVTHAHVKANPVGPPASSCFNCTAYDDKSSLDLALCNGGKPPGFQPTDPSWPVSNKNAYCSRLTCTGIPPGIGGGYAVFVDVYGEPPSLTVGDIDQKPTDASFTEAYAKFNYALPKIIEVSSSNDKLVCNTAACEAAPGDEITIHADNLPQSEGVVQTYRNGLSKSDAQKPVISVTIGGFECKLGDWNMTHVHCTVPEGSGLSLNLALTVAGQKARTPTPFSFPKPHVTGVSPNPIPSYGEPITVTGIYFGPTGTVMLNPSRRAESRSCETVSWSSTQVVCNPGPSGTDIEIKYSVSLTDASGTTTGSVIYDKCEFKDKGEYCNSNGSVNCTNNYACSSTGGDCNVKGAQCSCPADEDGTFCQNMGVLDSDCACKCVNGYTNDGGAEVEGSVPKAYAPGLCTSCSVSCGGLDKKVATSDKCGCEFNKLHLIWIIVLALLVVAVIGFGVWKWIQSRPVKKSQPLLNTHAAPDDEERGYIGDRKLVQDSENSVTEM